MQLANTKPKDSSFFEFGAEAYCFVDGPDEEFPERLTEDVPEQFHDRVQYWKTLAHEIPVLHELSDWLQELNKKHNGALNPYPGEDGVSNEILEVRFIHEAERVLVWRDFAINWYKRPGRCICFSRELSREEFEQFKTELEQALKA